ncbi:unnamed protein product [Rotaria sp. Silwood2]|nr:unnamed protein product [Rotaria sp. Silwood2]
MDHFKKSKCFCTIYLSKTSVEWHRGDSGICRILNEALRLKNYARIYNLRHFLIDLYQELQEMHKRQKPDDEDSLVLRRYRGQKMYRNELNGLINNISGLVFNNSFFSTTSNQKVALRYTAAQFNTAESVAVLFEIDIDTSHVTRHYGCIHPLPLSLLQNDHSKLTTNEWTLLSNFLHLFEEQNPAIRIQHSLNELYSLPPKLRSKSSELLKPLRELYTCVGPLIERSPDFYTLHVHARQILIKQNLYITGVINGLFFCRELNIFHNMIALNASNQLFGSQFMIECHRKIAQYDPNGNLIKILVFILAYSSNCSVVKYDNQEDISIMPSSIDLVHIQNLYVTMLWKYLVYLYGFKEAVLRFTQLVKNVVDLIDMFNRMPPNENSINHTSDIPILLDKNLSSMNM